VVEKQVESLGEFFLKQQLDFHSLIKFSIEIGIRWKENPND